MTSRINDFEKAAAIANPSPGPELEIIEQVKNETKYVDDNTTTPAAQAQPDSSAAQNGRSDSANMSKMTSISGILPVVYTTLYYYFGILLLLWSSRQQRGGLKAEDRPFMTASHRHIKAMHQQQL